MKKKIFFLSCMTGILIFNGCGRLLNSEILPASAEKQEMNIYESWENDILTNHDFRTSSGRAKIIDIENKTEDSDEAFFWSGSTVTISAEGDYIIQGNMPDGSIVVNACDDEVVHLFLDDVQISSGNRPALYVQNADKVIITLQDGTNNILSDNARHEKEANACIFSNVDLTINGQGKLSVFGYHKDGIRSKDQLKIVNSAVYVKAKGDGLRGNDGVILNDSVVEVECEQNGIFSESQKDIVRIQGGNCSIIAGERAINANTNVIIRDTEVELYAVLELIKCNGVKEIEEGSVNGN